MNRREALQRTIAITGFALTSSVGIGLLNGCKPSGDPDWKSKFLTKDEANLVTSIADTILPKSDTPGAIDVHVPEFIDLMLADNYTLEDQITFRKGLKTFTENVDQNYSNTFEKCTEDNKTSIIAEEENKSYEQLTKTYEKSTYLMIKELTILGYYSSEYVMNNMLDYHAIPGRYNGCIPFEKNGKLYVDNNV